MRAQLVHLSGPRRGQTKTYPEHNLLLGTDPDAQVRFAPGPGIAPRHAEIAYSPQNCTFYLRVLGGKVFVNHREVQEVQLQAGDLLELGADGPHLRFHVYVPPGSVCKPVRRMLSDAGDVAREAGLFAFTLSFARDLLTHATWQLKVFFPIGVLAIISTVAYLGGWLGAQSPMRRMEAREREQGEILTRVHDEFARGVCLVHGIYGFRVRGSEPPQWAQTEDGTRLEVEYTGSGFLVDHTGTILTNRHVVRPWTADERVQPLLRVGFEPVFFRLAVTFPGHDPVVVEPDRAEVRQDDVDVALLRAPAVLVADVPVLRLSEKQPRTALGRRVFVLGYPTGLRALLAKADVSLARRLTSEPDANQTSIIAGLAAADAIRPLVTQGVLADVTDANLVYDAETTSGGSGGPVLGDDGSVIGVNYAILREFGGSNFGVPVRFARELLGR